MFKENTAFALTTLSAALGNCYQRLAHGYRLPTTINYLVVGKLRSGFSLVTRKTINHPIGAVLHRRNKITRVIYNPRLISL